jgi:hypothetical protein
MAGTGHSYEIANPSALAEYCDGLRLLFNGIPEMSDRFSRADFRRFITSPAFCRLLKNPDSLEIDGSERPWIVRKLAAGQDVRLFSSANAEDCGPDFPHIRDYLHHVRLFDAAAYAKIARANFATLAAKSRTWRFRHRSYSTEEVRTSMVLELEHGLHWVELENSAAMSEEGRSQHHCVGMLSHLRDSGSHRYFSLRDGSNTSVATAELNIKDTNYWVQIRGKGNSNVPFEYQRASATLFNLFGGDSALSQYAAMSAGLHFSEGKWSPVADDWAPLEFDHIKLLSDGYARAAVFSPVDEGHVFAMIAAYPTSPDQEWSTSDDLKSGSIRLSVNRHIHEAEYRAACLIANKFGLDIRNDYDESNRMNKNVQKIGDRWEFIYDRYPSMMTPLGTEYSEFPSAELRYLVHETGYMIHHSNDKARILATVKDGKFVLENVGRINSHELGRLLDVATELNIVEIDVHKDDHRRFFSRYRPCRGKDGRWFDIRQEGATEPVPFSSMTWYSARDIKVLVGSVGQRLLTMSLSGDTAHVTSPGGIGFEVARVLAEEANRRDLVSMTCENVFPTLAWMYRLNGRWEYLPTVAKFTNYLTTLPNGANSLTKDEHLKLEVLSWQDHSNPVFAPIILTNVIHWLETANDKILSITPMSAHAGPYSGNVRLLYSVAGRLIWLADKRDQLSASQEVSLRRVLAMTFEKLCSAEPSKISSNEALALAQIVTRYLDCFTKKQIYSAALRSLQRVFNFVATKNPDELAPYEADWLRWYEVVLPTLTEGRLKLFLIDRIRQNVVVAMDFEKSLDLALIERVISHYHQCRLLPASGSHWQWHIRQLHQRINSLASDESQIPEWQRITAVVRLFDKAQERGCNIQPANRTLPCQLVTPIS